MLRDPCDAREWTTEFIGRECGSAYRKYERALIDRYTGYFESHPHLRCLTHRYSARTLAAALPPGHGHLAHVVPREHLHRFARSGRSSQILTLALIGAALARDPTLKWFWRAVDLSHLCVSTAPRTRFEHALSPDDLGEHPRVTVLDFSISNSAAFAAIETKWSEPGFGTCSCTKDGDGSPLPGFDCSARVLARRAYWRTANDCFGIDAVRLPIVSCETSANYQPIRNAAAALTLADGRVAVFVLLYDEENPYFRPTGEWPGWPLHLQRSIRSDTSNITFRAVSWQRLMAFLPLPLEVRRWAAEKHGLKV